MKNNCNKELEMTAANREGAHRKAVGFLSKLAAAGNGKAVEKISPDRAKE